jgi:hypothetical protein
MEVVISVLALLFIALVALGVYATVKAVGAAKRGVERTVGQALRTVEDTTLRAKSLGQTGVAGELAQLRLALRTSMRATQDALRAGAAEDASLSESLALFERLSVHARELDDEMKQLEREPDRAKVAERLPELRERLERITHPAEALRWAARDRAKKFAEDDMDALSTQIDMEAGALRHWTTEEEPRTEAGPAAGRTAGSTTGTGGDWPAAETGGAGQTWPEEGAARPTAETAADPAEEGPRALPPRDPRVETYPWQKAPRPEASN